MPIEIAIRRFLSYTSLITLFLIWLPTLLYLQTIDREPLILSSVATIFLINRVSTVVGIFFLLENVTYSWIHLWWHIRKHQDMLRKNFLLLSSWFSSPLALLHLPLSLISLTLLGLLNHKFTPRHFHVVNIAIDVIFLILFRINLLIVAFFTVYSL